MSQFDECMEQYKTAFNKLNINYDETLLTAVAKGLGPSIYNKDSSLVSGSDKTELDTVKNNFLIKKLGLNDGPELDAAITKTVETLGKSNPNKYRACFYYLLTKEFGKEDIYA